jgi:hypothetical protein
MKAYTDYRVRVAGRNDKLEWYEISELESAFTREFEYLRSEGRVRPSDWPRFIERYAGQEMRTYGGSSTPNTSKMRNLLSSESFSIRSPGEQTEHWERERNSLADAMYQEAIRHPDARSDIAEHKARIDAEMLIAVSRTMADAHTTGTGERYILITSARRLRHLPPNVKAKLPDVPDVLSLAEAATIASLLPDQPISLRALHALLFEGHFQKLLAVWRDYFLELSVNRRRPLSLAQHVGCSAKNSERRFCGKRNALERQKARFALESIATQSSSRGLLLWRSTLSL